MELEESGAEVGGFQRTLKDLFAGAAGGIAQVLLGQLVPICLLSYLQHIPLNIINNLLLFASSYTLGENCYLSRSSLELYISNW